MITASNRLAAACLAGAIATTAGAQETADDDAIEEVVVTARQRAESITDVPATITAFSAQDIERAGIQRAEDFVLLTPGVSLVNTAEVGDTQLSIRGINGARDGEANFAFIVDGILHTNPSAFNREFADLRQIEILKGPQGAQYGRSAASGAIIVTTNAPGDEFDASFKASAGSDDRYYFSGSAGGPLIKDELAGRVHVDYRHTDGFFKNNFLDNEHVVDNFENYNVSGRLVWDAREDLTVDMKMHYGEVDAAAISFNAAFALPVFGSQPEDSPLFEDVNNHNFFFHNNVNPSNDQEAMDFSIKFDYDMSWATLTGWFLYSDVEQQFLADGTSGAFGFFAGEPACRASALATVGEPFPAPTFNTGEPAPFAFVAGGSFYGPYTPTTCDGYQYQERNQDDRSFEFRLTSNSDQQLRWQVGFYYLDLDREVGVAQLVDDGRTNLPQSLVNPLTEALVSDDFQTEVWAVFGNLQYDVTDTVELALALRYDREDREASSNVPAPNVQRSNFIDYTVALFGCDDGLAGSPLNPAYVDFTTCTVNNSIPDRSEVWDEIQPKITARWDASDEVSLFASWGRGFKSGGFNNLGSADTINLFFNNPAVGAGLSISDEFEKETSDAFEVGFKGNYMGGRAQVTGALFYTDIDDMQFFNFFVGPFGLLRVVSNIDEASIFGGELGMAMAVTDQVRVFGGFSYVNGEIDRNRNRPQTEGNEIPYAAEYTFNVGGEFVQPALLFNADFVVRVDYSHVGETWFSTVQANDQTPTLFTAPSPQVPTGFGLADWSLTKRDDYGILNFRVGFEHDQWGVHAVLRNALNKKYLEEIIPAPEFGGSFIHPGARRFWAVEVAYNF